MARSEVHGSVAEGFEEVRAEFTAVVEEREDTTGVQLAAYRDGRLVVDLWAGHQMDGDSMTGVHSITKGAAFVVVAWLVQEGVLELDRAVSFYWPEFGAAGTSSVSVRDLLTHRAGLVGADGGLGPTEFADDVLIAQRMATQRPYWRPGAGYGYHAFTIGALAGEVVRRVTGRSIQQLYEERVRAPHGLDFYLGLPEALESRCVDLLPWQASAEQEARMQASWPGPHSLAAVAYNLNATPPLDLVGFANTREVRAGGMTSAGGIGSAKGVAGMYAAAVTGLAGRPPLLGPETVAEYAMLHTTGSDLVRGQQNVYALGFEAKGQQHQFLSAKAIGHSGTPGHDSFVDPCSGLAYAYLRQRFAFGFTAPENTRLAAAVHEAAVRSHTKQ